MNRNMNNVDKEHLRNLMPAWCSTMNLITLYSLIAEDSDALGTGINRVAGLEYVTQHRHTLRKAG